MPRISRKTALALAVSVSLVIAAGGMATAAVLKLPAFGFGSAAPGRRVVTRRTVPRIIYHDHYVTKPAVPEQPAANSAGSDVTPTPAPAAAPAPALPRPEPSRQPRALPVDAASLPAAAPAPPPPDPPTTQAPPSARPAAPANCREPEWDQEHLVWHCSNGDD